MSSFRMDIGKRIVVHGLLEIDCIEDFDAVVVPLQELSALNDDLTLPDQLQRSLNEAA